MLRSLEHGTRSTSAGGTAWVTAAWRQRSTSHVDWACVHTTLRVESHRFVVSQAPPLSPPADRTLAEPAGSTFPCRSFGGRLRTRTTARHHLASGSRVPLRELNVLWITRSLSPVAPVILTFVSVKSNVTTENSGLSARLPVSSLD